MEIDQILEFLNWNNSESVQQKGRIAAEKIKHFYILIQPGCNKAIWDNCAAVIVKKSDEELDPYLFKLLEWLQDLTWPGAGLIIERLQKMNTAILEPAFVSSARNALKLQDGPWIQNLVYLLKTSPLEHVIDFNLQRDLNLLLQKFEEES